MTTPHLRKSVGAALRQFDHRARRVNAGARALPDFVIIGAQKAGTTALYAYLRTHPDVFPALKKEVHYFDIHYSEGEQWYRGMFPTRSRLRAASRHRRRTVVTGEASPYYLFHPLAAERAARLIPGARLVVLLRDPVERAWSHYRHEVRAGREELDFADALAAEPERLARAADAVRAGGADGPAAAHRTASYVSRGRYAEQLQRWLTHFSREALLVVQAQELFSNPAREYDRVLRFLGIAPAPGGHFEVHNAGQQSPMDPALRTQLRQLYREPNEQLADLLGTRLPWS